MSTVADIRMSRGDGILRCAVGDAPADIVDMLLVLAADDEEMAVEEALDPIGLVDAIGDLLDPHDVLTLISGLRRWSMQSALGHGAQPTRLVTAASQSFSELAESLGVAEYVHSPLSALAPLVGDAWIADNLRWSRCASISRTICLDPCRRLETCRSSRSS